ncbi:MAG: ExbD/TolR family protein [Phycisphaerales bacterium]
MRKRITRQHEPPFEAVNVTPLIDVVMCLIVFFLIVGKLVNDTGNVRLPFSGFGRGEAAASAVTVSVARPEQPGRPVRLFVDGRAVVGEGELRAVIAQRVGVRETATDAGSAAGLGAVAVRPVHVRCDRELPFSAVEPVLRACAALGIPGVRVATERNAGGGS